MTRRKERRRRIRKNRVRRLLKLQKFFWFDGVNVWRVK